MHTELWGTKLLIWSSLPFTSCWDALDDLLQSTCPSSEASLGLAAAWRIFVQPEVAVLLKPDIFTSPFLQETLKQFLHI